MLGGKYKLLKKLGQGGMGTVYKAHDEKLDRIVAIKVLAKEFSSKDAYVQRFLREGRVMVKLDHPNVIRCYDIDKDEEKGLHFLAIEFVEGGSVEGWLKKLGRFSIGDALHIILMAATGLQHAHEKSLIHRDVKPDNLLLTKEGLVKVADLGLAKDTAEDTSLTKTGSGAGTPIYMAPEQARDVKHVDCKVDIYALGVMLYVFLTGQPPFQGNTLVELISAKEKGKFEPMRKHNDDVPGKLDLIVDKMISKDPKNRYASCQEVIDEIEPLGLHNEALSFIESEGPPSNGVKKPASKVATTKGPSAIASKTSVSAKGPAAKTSAPASAGDTDPPEEPEEETHGVWYWQFESESGRPITKKLTTEQVRTLIKSGHLDATGRLSKTEKSGFRGAGTYTDFQPIFKSLRAATKANSRASSRGKMSDIIAEDERRRKYGWIGRMFKSTGGMLFGLLWIVLILGVVGGGGYFLWKYMNP
jgi:serine/threonine-protein kinase